MVCRRGRCAFTLVELLVVIAIIGILVGLLLPAMQNMRELSRRSSCQQNLAKLSLALSSYNDRYGQFPAGTLNADGPIKSQEAGGYHHNWLIGLMPMLDANVVADAVDSSVSVYDDANAEVRALAIPGLRCPSASDVAEHTTCYAGITSSIETPIDEDNDGVFRLNLPVRERDVSDGLGQTVFLGEKISSIGEDLGWISGTRSSLRNGGHPINAELQRIRGPVNPANAINASYVGGLASDHPGGVHLLMGSGEIQFRSSSMDTKLFAQLASRADGAIPLEWKTKMPVKMSEKATTASQPAPASEPETTSEPATDSEPMPDSEPAPDSEPESTSEPETTSEPSKDVEKKSEPAEEVEPAEEK